MTIMTTAAPSHLPRKGTFYGNNGVPESRALVDWRGLDAFVLLGDPGAGKSESMRMEALQTGGIFVKARDFITLGIEPFDRGKTVFIDGLDETRAGALDGRVPLDKIRTRLQELGYPRFRLSCREHDWRSQTDLPALQRVAPGGNVHELHLDPLTRDEQLELLCMRAKDIGDAKQFLTQAERNSIAILFGNPLLLELTVKAVARGGWPSSREAIYVAACRELATEISEDHLDSRPLEPGQIERILDDAGILCALMLLSGKDSVTTSLSAGGSAIALHELPEHLRIGNSRAALGSKVFARVKEDYFPRHRSIAEFLAAKAVSARVMRGLPLGRVLALMRGHDHGIVEPLRGLLGWLAVHDARDRHRLMKIDPLSVVLNGDVTTFSYTDRLALLEGLGEQARANPWFRRQHWVSHPFGPLASPEMVPALSAVLRQDAITESHQALLDCVLDAINNAPPIADLAGDVKRIVEDSRAWPSNRLAALRAWKNCVRFDPAQSMDLLRRLRSGEVRDEDARLAAELLKDLYPLHIGPDTVLDYWPRPSELAVESTVPSFWLSNLIENSRPTDFPVLARAWRASMPTSQHYHLKSQRREMGSRILSKLLDLFGDTIDDATLFRWLGLGIDEYGFSKLGEADFAKGISAWLSDRPARMKGIVALAWARAEPDPQNGFRYFWEGEQRLHRAKFPSDWLRWLLQHAAETPSADVASYCLSQVARAVIDQPLGLEVPQMADLEDWVRRYSPKWPEAERWLISAWSCPLAENWQREDYAARRKHEAQALSRREERRKSIEPFISGLLVGGAPPALWYQIAHAHEGLFIDINGETGTQRVQDFLVTDVATAERVLQGLEVLLQRTDIPSASEILTISRKGKCPWLRPAILLAARLTFARDSQSLQSWNADLVRTLAASWLTDGTGNSPAWYSELASTRPAEIAPVVIEFVRYSLRNRKLTHVTGLWQLANDGSFAGLSRLILPKLLMSFPLKSSVGARSELNSSLLRSIGLLDDREASKLIAEKLTSLSMDPTQRISWLVAQLPYQADAIVPLLALVGKSERRLASLGVALQQQQVTSRLTAFGNAGTLGRLIEGLAPVTKPERPEGAYWVGDSERRGDTVRALVNMLAGSPTREASLELERLSQLPSLAAWHRRLQYGAVAQRSVAREANFVHASPISVALTLANREPANQADLMALVIAHLLDIEQQARGSDAYQLRSFWNGQKSEAIIPKDENACRDELLISLRTRLDALRISVHPESRAAAEKRADLRVQFMSEVGQLAVPLEIKKEGHRKLWTAWQDQLQTLYSIDPATGGTGIYLVLWFGTGHKASASGRTASSPEELQNLLADMVPENDRARLAIVVLNLSIPDKLTL